MGSLGAKLSDRLVTGLCLQTLNLRWHSMNRNKRIYMLNNGTVDSLLTLSWRQETYLLVKILSNVTKDFKKIGKSRLQTCRISSKAGESMRKSNVKIYLRTWWIVKWRTNTCQSMRKSLEEILPQIFQCRELGTSSYAQVIIFHIQKVTSEANPQIGTQWKFKRTTEVWPQHLKEI